MSRMVTKHPINEAAAQVHLTKQRPTTYRRQFEQSETGASLLALQQVHGNRYVQRVIQPKLDVNQPGDEYEREADQVADRIVRMPDPATHFVQGTTSNPVQRLASSMFETPGSEATQSEVLRDVHAQTADAVAEASETAGAALPTLIRRKFEVALGTDLSEVQVHVDSKSDKASKVLGARAYATGSEIHFSQGRFNPDSIEGQHLLAHEVVHTLQQSSRTGGTQGEVASPAQDSSRPSTTVVQCDRAGDLTDLAQAGEEQAMSDLHRNDTQPPAMRVSNIGDIQAARALAEQIEGWRGMMLEGSKAGGAFTTSPNRVTPDKIDANEKAIRLLNDYLITAGEQSRTIGSFQGSLQAARMNYARLTAQITHLTVTNAISGGTAGDIGRQIVQGAGLADAESAQQRMRQLTSNPSFSISVLKTQVQLAHDNMVKLGEDAGEQQAQVSQMAYSYNSSLDNFKTGLPAVNDNPEQAKELSELKERIEKVQSYLGKGLEYAGKGLGKLGVPGAETAGEHAEPVVKFLTNQYYDAELNGLLTKGRSYSARYQANAIEAKLNSVRASSLAFRSAMIKFVNTVKHFGEAQTEFRQQLNTLGRSADTGAGHSDRYAQIASVLAEVDTYETQLDETLRLAYQEQAAASEATSSRNNLQGKPSEGPANGMSYYQPYLFRHNYTDFNYECQEHELRMGVSLLHSADGAVSVGVNATIDRAVQDLQQFRKEIEPMRLELARAMDLRMNEDVPEPPQGPPPTSIKENTEP